MVDAKCGRTVGGRRQGWNTLKKGSSHIGVLVALALLLSACGGGEKKLDELEKRVSELESSQAKLQMELANLRFESIVADWDKVAFVKPDDSGYSAVRFDLGVLTVKLSDVKAYASGSKITLSFGNMTSARIDGLKAKLEWGKIDAKGLVLDDTVKTRDVVFKEPMVPGAWTDSEVVLDSIPPADLGFVRLRDVGHRGISLRR